MNIDYQDVLIQASVILRNIVEEKYLKDFPDLDINLVKVNPPDEINALFQALIKEMNEKYGKTN
jgi:hypothetical protein